MRMVELRADSGAGTHLCGRRSQPAYPVMHLLWAGTICGVRRQASTLRVDVGVDWLGDFGPEESRFIGAGLGASPRELKMKADFREEVSPCKSQLVFIE